MYVYICVCVCVCVCVYARVACLRRATSLWPKLRNIFGNRVSVNERLVPISTKTKLSTS